MTVILAKKRYLENIFKVCHICRISHHILGLVFSFLFLLVTIWLVVERVYN